MTTTTPNAAEYRLISVGLTDPVPSDDGSLADPVRYRPPTTRHGSKADRLIRILANLKGEQKHNRRWSDE